MVKENNFMKGIALSFLMIMIFDEASGGVQLSY
jgi:hypothetical protein